jgi:hypothetical protein
MILGRKGLSFHRGEILIQDFRVVVLEMTGAAGAQRDDVVVVAATEGRNILLGHVHGGFALAHHFEGQPQHDCSMGKSTATFLAARIFTQLPVLRGR